MIEKCFGVEYMVTLNHFRNNDQHMLFFKVISEWTSESELTWMQAQTYCSDRNSSLIQGYSQHEQGSYWTGEYFRLSSWMHIIGNGSSCPYQFKKYTYLKKHLIRDQRD